jgi:YidC/Oxa1 family membrane protein insertase
MTTDKMKLQMPKGVFPKLGKKNIILLVLVVALMVVVITVGVSGLVDAWNIVLLQPMLNFLIILSNVFFHNFGIAIIVLVIIVRLLMLPVTLKQLHSTKAMSSLQPKLQEIQKKYGGDRVKLQQEMSRIYKESGVNPMGCIWPMAIQFPIWIALYQSIMKALAATPEDLLGLSGRLYSSSYIIGAVPLNEHFLWLNLGKSDIPMAVLVAASMWVLQKMSTLPSSTSDPKQQSMQTMMTWMMPLVFGMITMMYSSGLGLYFLVSNIVGIVIQYFVSFKRAPKALTPAAPNIAGTELPKGADLNGKEASGGVNQKGSADGQSREKRKDSRRSHRAGVRRARRKS